MCVKILLEKKNMPKYIVPKIFKFNTVIEKHKDACSHICIKMLLKVWF